MARRKGRRPEYVVICREFNREMARIDISVIDSGVTDQLMKGLIALHMRDPHKRYFLTSKSDYHILSLSAFGIVILETLYCFKNFSVIYPSLQITNWIT